MTNQTKKKRRKWLWLGGVILLVTLAVSVVLPRVSGFGPNAARNSDDLETVIAFTGNLSANATASGQIEAQRSTSLALGQTGTVSDIYVTAGDEVEVGDPLLKLDTTDLERAVLNAQQALAIQEANLANMLAPASPADIAAAEASVASAQAALADLLGGSNEDEIIKAKAEVRAAEADMAAAADQLQKAQGNASAAEIQAAQLQLELAQKVATEAAQQHSTILVTEPEGFLTQERLDEMEFSARAQALQANANLAAAQETYEQLVGGEASAIASASAQVALATASRDAAQANLDLLLLGASAAQIASAEATLAQARANLGKLLRGPSEAQIVQPETAVAQARTQLQNAQYNLAEATLVAPFAGVVTAVNVNVGEQASGILVELVDHNSLEVVLDVDEVDIGKISAGQNATITLEAWPNEKIEGAVSAVAPITTNDGNAVVSYEVFVKLNQTDLPILIGMSANAELSTKKLENVLLVPNSAIKADRSNGRFTVNKVVTDAAGNVTYEEVEVRLGLRDGRNTQIISGLEAGEELLVGNIPPTFQFGPGGDGGPDRGNGGGPFGGGG